MAEEAEVIGGIGHDPLRGSRAGLPEVAEEEERRLEKGGGRPMAEASPLKGSWREERATGGSMHQRMKGAPRTISQTTFPLLASANRTARIRL